MLEREQDEEARGGLLCDEMGLGKTWSTLGLLMNSPLKHTLLFCPLAVVHQWVSAAMETGFGIWTVKGGSWMKVSGSGNTFKRQLFIVNYDKLLFNPSLFKERIWHRIVCDEAHTIRNPETSRYSRMKKIRAERWWFLSGTPIVNRPTDLQALLHLMNRSISIDKTYTTEQLTVWMNTYALQRTVTMVRSQLPDAPRQPIINQLSLPFASEEEATFYKAVQGCTASQLQSAFESDMNNMHVILLLLLRLRQISVHPQVYINAKRRELKSAYGRADWDGHSTKTTVLGELLEKERQGRGWVVFCNFHDEITQLREMLAKEPSVGQIEIYDGSLSAAERQSAIERTVAARASAAGAEEDGRHTVFLVQILCGGTGLNLQHMDRVVFMSPWWTAALMDQALGRVLRMGQKEEVVVYHLRLEEEEAMNIDEIMNDKVVEKRELCELMLEHANHLTGYADEEESEEEGSDRKEEVLFAPAGVVEEEEDPMPTENIE